MMDPKVLIGQLATTGLEFDSEEEDSRRPL
jgi:hypothetical protein